MVCLRNISVDTLHKGDTMDDDDDDDDNDNNKKNNNNNHHHHHHHLDSVKKFCYTQSCLPLLSN
jgi:hypothetical protein